MKVNQEKEKERPKFRRSLKEDWGKGEDWRIKNGLPMSAWLAEVVCICCICMFDAFQFRTSTELRDVRIYLSVCVVFSCTMSFTISVKEKGSSPYILILVCVCICVCVETALHVIMTAVIPVWYTQRSGTYWLHVFSQFYVWCVCLCTCTWYMHAE